MNATETTATTWLDIVQLAAHLNCSASSIRRWCRLGVFPQPRRFGTRVLRWRKSDVEQWIENQNKDYGL